MNGMLIQFLVIAIGIGCWKVGQRFLKTDAVQRHTGESDSADQAAGPALRPAHLLFALFAAFVLMLPGIKAIPWFCAVFFFTGVFLTLTKHRDGKAILIGSIATCLLVIGLVVGAMALLVANYHHSP